MEMMVWAIAVAVMAYSLKTRAERTRIRLLASHLRQYDIEKLMETLLEGYARALGEPEAGRRESIWQVLAVSEARLAEQFSRFASGFEKVPEAQARVSRLPFTLPYADRLVPALTFDLREALKVHARGIERAVSPETTGSGRDRAFTLSAELFLMQHTCHWFCKSRAVASARLLVRHQTSYALAISSVSRATRDAYLALVGRNAAAA
ncbi:MAG: hypothetical protein V4731_03805 [Pseudomonadota bacterium]